MDKTMYGFSDRLKDLRSKMNLTQADLAKKLSLTRASVNAWEMGLSAPSTPFIVELSRLFNVSTDYLLGLDDTAVIRTDDLSDEEIAVIMNTVQCFRNLHNRSD